MDPELAGKINELGTGESGGEGEKYSALTVEFRRRGGDLHVRVSDDVGRRVEYRLKELRELYSAQRERPGTSWGGREVPSSPQHHRGGHFPVLPGAPGAHGRAGTPGPRWAHPGSGTGRGGPLRTLIRDSLRFQLSVAEWSREEVLGCPRKVRRSVERHHKRGGMRGYLDFIVQFL